MYGIICTNCLGGAVVSGLDLRIYQLKWEEELQAILNSLVEHPLRRTIDRRKRMRWSPRQYLIAFNMVPGIGGRRLLALEGHFGSLAAAWQAPWRR